MRLKNKIAIVTGGSMGIGQATAARFAQEGAKVVIMDIAESEGRETERMLRQLTSPQSILKVFPLRFVHTFRPIHRSGTR